MNQIIEKISWIPHELAIRLRFKKENPVKLNLKKIGLKREFLFHTLEGDEGLSNQLNSFGLREPLNLKYYYDFVEKTDKVLDAGANIGLFSILSENAKEIVCVEPVKECMPVLKKNLEENGILEKSTIVNMAIGKEGKLFLKKEGKVNLSKVVEHGGEGTFEVESKPLSYFVKKYRSNLLRMDVEGYEYEILINKIPKEINKIAIEFHTILLGNKKVKELLEYFQKEKFKVKYLIEDLPIRLYPFHNLLCKTRLINSFTYVKKDLEPKDCLEEIKRGRAVKYLILER